MALFSHLTEKPGSMMVFYKIEGFMRNSVQDNIQNNKRNKKSSLLELFSLAFLIHFGGALFYSAFVVSNYRNPESWWPVWYVHLLLGGISIPSIIITIVLERLYAKPMSITVFSVLFRLWVFGICILVCWTWIQRA